MAAVEADVSGDPDRPVTLTTCATEVEAALVVAALERAGIRAEATGGYTSAFRAEVPGVVSVLVRARDLEQARAILADRRRE